MKNKSFLRAIIVGICSSCEWMNNFLFSNQNEKSHCWYCPQRGLGGSPPKSQTPSFQKVCLQSFLHVVMRKTTISLHPRLGLSILLPHLKTSLVGKEKESWSYGLWNQIVRENVKKTLLVKIPNGTMRLSPSVICSIATILIWIYDTYKLLFQYCKHIQWL